ncbi:hypothetical protein OROMI_007025 [Orobanche minor]
MGRRHVSVWYHNLLQTPGTRSISEEGYRIKLNSSSLKQRNFLYVKKR